MTHPLVTQLRFARSEFQRCLDGLTDQDARKRLGPMNSISWMIGHLANQEHFYWVYLAQDQNVAGELYKLVGTGRPATTPPLSDMWDVWHTVTETADVYLDSISSDTPLHHFTYRDETWGENVGTLLLRNIYHYWFHNGEAHAVRQQLGHQDLPQFVGNMSAATYTPE